MSKPARKAKNLSLAPDAVERGEEYSQLHGTNLSRLVSDFLLLLPMGKPGQTLSPAVQRLRGIAADSSRDRSTYQEHLYRKYGGR